MIILCPSPARDYAKRRWDKWPQLADAIVEKYGAVEFVGTTDQWDYVSRIICQMKYAYAVRNRCGEFEMLDFMKFIQQAKLVVTVNTFTMHAAMALEVPCVAIIGGTPASIVIAEGQKNIAYVEDPALADWDDGRYGEPRINEITVEQVMEKIDGIYNHPREE